MVMTKMVAINVAMGGGTCLNTFRKHFLERCFDVGIVEQHAVTFDAGLATEWLKPFCDIYSSFHQRGYHLVVHDVDLQKLPMRFTNMVWLVQMVRLMVVHLIQLSWLVYQTWWLWLLRVSPRSCT